MSYITMLMPLIRILLPMMQKRAANYAADYINHRRGIKKPLPEGYSLADICPDTPVCECDDEADLLLVTLEDDPATSALAVVGSITVGALLGVVLALIVSRRKAA